MKVATVFYYSGNPEYSHLRPEHAKRCVQNLIDCGIDRVIIRDDGSDPWLRWREIEPNHDANRVTIFNAPHRQGINEGMKWMAARILNEDLILHVDPHMVFDKDKLAKAFKTFDDDPALEVAVLPMIPGRVSRGTWAGYRSDWVDNKAGVNLVMICRGFLYRRFAEEYLGKLQSKDMSWPLSHFENWFHGIWKDDKERKEHYKEFDEIFGRHEDELTFWSHLQNCYNNGMKAAETKLEGLPMDKQMMIKSLRSFGITQWFQQVESCLWWLGAAAGKFSIDDKMNYEDVVYSGEEPDPRVVFELPYMLMADKFVVGSVLDVGCGNGIFGLYAWSMRPHVHDERKGKSYGHDGTPHSAMLGLPLYQGIDVNETAIKQARKGNQDTSKVLAFNRGDILTEQGEDRYDTVLMLEVLEHLRDGDRGKAVDAGFRLCRHRVVASVPRTVEAQSPMHWKTTFTDQEIRELFKQFKKVDLEYADVYRWLVIAHKREIP